MRAFLIAAMLVASTTAVADAPFDAIGTWLPLPYQELPQSRRIPSANRADDAYDALLQRVRTSASPVEAVQWEVHEYISYRPDTSDVWQDAVTTVRRQVGDCEDIAILKYWLLRDVGFAPDQLRMLVGHTQQGLPHAVVAVLVGGNWFVLDNLYGPVVRDASARFRPAYALNEDAYWLYLGG